MRSLTVLACLLLCGCSLASKFWEGGDLVSPVSASRQARVERSHQEAAAYRSLAKAIDEGKYDKTYQGKSYIDEAAATKWLETELESIRKTESDKRAEIMQKYSPDEGEPLNDGSFQKGLLQIADGLEKIK